MTEMTDEIYDDLTDMFTSSGWLYFMQDVEQNLEGVNTLSDIVGEQALGMKQGQVAILQGILKYKDTIEQVWSQSNEETAEEDTDQSIQL